jgi:hypothetical protein
VNEFFQGDIDEDNKPGPLPTYHFLSGAVCGVRHIDFKEPCATRYNSDRQSGL